MNTNTNTGGPAFPTVSREWKIEDGPLAGNSGFEYVDPGMTLRDYFAAKAMPQLLSLCSTHESSAQEAYKMADAMLKARDA
jgi:hypothetical protein